MAEISSGVYRTNQHEPVAAIRGDTYKLPVLATVRDLNGRLVILLNNLEWPVLLVPNNLGVIVFTTNETLGVEDGVFGIAVVCVFGGVTDETFLICETDP